VIRAKQFVQESEAKRAPKRMKWTKIRKWEVSEAINRQRQERIKV